MFACHGILIPVWQAGDLRERIRDTKQRLVVSRDDADRKKALVTTLQKRYKEVSRHRNEEARHEEERSRSLSQIRRESARKDAAIKNLRSEVLESRRSEEKTSELLEAGNAAACGARSKHAKVKAELKAELVQRDKELHHAEAKVQLLKARAVGEEQIHSAASSQVSFVPLQKSLEDVPEMDTPSSHFVSTLPRDSFEIDPSVRSSGIGALEQELSGVLLRAANSIESSWEQSAVRESLEILNLQLDDLPAFFSGQNEDGRNMDICWICKLHLHLKFLQFIPWELVINFLKNISKTEFDIFWPQICCCTR